MSLEVINRRGMLAAMAAALVSRGRQAHGGESPGYQVRELEVPGDRRVGRRFSLLVPTHTRGKVPLLVALHGLGETHDEKLGVRAWLDLYGLASTYQRLLRPPIARVDRKARYWRDERLVEVNAELDKRPFGGLAIACPYTPNVYKAPSREKLLDDYAEWIANEVVPRARKEAPVLEGTRHTGLDGCSLGGYVGIEVFLRKPELFGAWGTVQGALGEHRVQGYAERLRAVIDRHGKRPIHVETSTADAFREVNEAFSRKLKALGVEHDFTMPPGPHNQPFLRDSGTLEMLLWHDRVLR